MDAVEAPPLAAPVWAFTGVPGSGKSTLCDALAARSARALIRSGDIARSVDPDAVGDGRLAGTAEMWDAMVPVLAGAPLPLILDGLPRTPDQLALLPPGSLVFVLWCREDVVLHRLRDRGRPDDTPDLIRRRYREQDAVLRGAWLTDAATYRRRLNTSIRSREDVLEGVWRYITGQKREVY